MKRYIAYVVVAWAAPLLVGLVVLDQWGDESDATWVHRDEPRFVSVGLRSFDGAQPASVMMTWSEAESILGPERTGRVTAVLVAPGDQIRQGQPILRIDDHLVIAQVGGVPLYRDLRRGDHGADVVEFARLLSIVLDRRISTTDATLDTELESAIADFHERNGRGRLTTFEVEDLVYLPHEIEVGRVDVTVGQRLTGPEKIGESVQHLIDADVILEGTSGRTALVSDGQAILSFPGGRRIPVEDLGPDLGALADVVEPGSDMIGGVVIRRATPRTYGVVPSSAVVSDDGDCIYLVDGSGALTVHHLDDSTTRQSIELGMTYVTSQLIDRQVLVNPGQLAGANSCS